MVTLIISIVCHLTVPLNDSQASKAIKITIRVSNWSFYLIPVITLTISLSLYISASPFTLCFVLRGQINCRQCNLKALQVITQTCGSQVRVIQL